MARRGALFSYMEGQDESPISPEERLQATQSIRTTLRSTTQALSAFGVVSEAGDAPQAQAAPTGDIFSLDLGSLINFVDSTRLPEKLLQPGYASSHGGADTPTTAASDRRRRRRPRASDASDAGPPLPMSQPSSGSSLPSSRRRRAPTDGEEATPDDSDFEELATEVADSGGVPSSWLPCPPLPVQPASARPPRGWPLHSSPRRQVQRFGDQISSARSATARHQQLRAMLPQLTAGGSPSSAASSPRKGSSDDSSVCPMAPRHTFVTAVAAISAVRAATPKGERFSLSAAKAAAESEAQAQRHRHSLLPPPSAPLPPTNFTQSFVAGLRTKPRIEQHPLLVSIAQGDADGFSKEQELGVEQASLAYRMDELRWSESRRGPWAAPPGPKRPPADDGMELRGVVRKALDARPPFLDKGSKKAAAAAAAGQVAVPPQLMKVWHSVVHQFDPDDTGVVSPETLVPLMFWLGLTRKRTSALLTLRLAFGPGGIPVDSLNRLCSYIDVQTRLVEGLRRVARRDSLEQLCEYITDGDSAKLRMWFFSMRRSPGGQADLVEVQNLFAREGVMQERQAFFRFLGHMTRNELQAPSGAGAEGEKSATSGKQRRIGRDEFSSLICRAMVAWCIHSAIGLIASPAPLVSDVVGGDAPLAQVLQPGGDSEMALRWAQLQRKIIASLLINHRFWGRDSRTVLSSLRLPGVATAGEDLPPEQWQALFQRVRAQGMGAILPEGEEAEDPEFLVGKTKHAEIPGINDFEVVRRLPSSSGAVEALAAAAMAARAAAA